MKINIILTALVIQGAWAVDPSAQNNVPQQTMPCDQEQLHEKMKQLFVELKEKMAQEGYVLDRDFVDPNLLPGGEQKLMLMLKILSDFIPSIKKIIPPTKDMFSEKFESSMKEFFDQKKEEMAPFKNLKLSKSIKIDALYELMNDINRIMRFLANHLNRNRPNIASFLTFEKTFDAILSQVSYFFKSNNEKQTIIYDQSKENDKINSPVSKFYTLYGTPRPFTKTWGKPSNPVWIILFVSPLDPSSRLLVKSAMPRLISYLKQNPDKLYIVVVHYAQAKHWPVSKTLWQKDDFYDAFFQENPASLIADTQVSHTQDLEQHSKEIPGLVPPCAFFVMNQKAHDPNKPYPVTLESGMGAQPGTLLHMVRNALGGNDQRNQRLFDRGGCA